MWRATKNTGGGTFMTIQVVTNPDGTIKVTCGSDSVLVGSPPLDFPDVTDTTGMGTVVANIVDSSAWPADAQHVDGVADVLASLKGWVRALNAGPAAAAPRLNFVLKGGQHAIDIEQINGLLRGPDAQPLAHCVIYLDRPRG
jgi:hypothetical protein